jgi:hypothetical protein
MLSRMSSNVDVARGMVRASRVMFRAQMKALPLDDALFAAGGWRSGLGVLKHAAAWLEVYRSYAFEPEPRHWARASWPRGLVHEIEVSQEYVDEVTAWLETELDAWDASLAALHSGDLSNARPVHWGGTMPLADVVVVSMQHVTYHLGELNMLLSIRREEAWEWGEEVEENHIDTFGHGVRAGWMDEATAMAVEERLRVAHELRATP